MSKRVDELKSARALSVGQITSKIKDLEHKVMNLRQDKLLGKLKNPQSIGELKKSIARLRTILDEKLTQAVVQKS